MRCTVWLGTRSFAERHGLPPVVGSSQGDALAGSPRGIRAQTAPSPRLWPILLGALLAVVAAALMPASALAATKTWSGLGGNANWSNPGNWVEGVAPVANDDLMFPAGASGLSNTNNLTPGTTFHSIAIGGSGYILTGNAVTIADGSVIVAFLPNGTTSTINLPVSGNGTNITVGGTGARLVFGGGLTDAGSWQKLGPGTMVLSAPGTNGMA